VIRQAGFGSWIKHLWGEPAWMGPFNFPLHVLGELIKPVSLSARLFGNILGEDKLLAAFLGMGMLIVATITHNPTPIVGVPLQLPFFFLVVLGSTIQALVFSLLASIYIVLLLPHDDHHDDAHAADHGAAVAHAAPAKH
jgi:F-type H+-transporting ATPase subunit a